MQRKEVLLEQIERTRSRLDHALEVGTDVDSCYEISLELDKMIEQYIDFSEEERVSV